MARTNDPAEGPGAALQATVGTPPVSTFGPLRLTPGTSRINMGAYYWLALSSIMLFTFLGALYAPLLTTVLDVPEGEQGRVTGVLGLVGEIILIVVVAVSAARSDLAGRRVIAVTGYAIFGLGLLLTAAVGNVLSLVGARAVAGIGIAMITGMLTAIVADYVRSESRGKANGFLGFCNGVGAILTFTVLAQLPRAFENAGLSEVAAIRVTYVVAAVIALVSAVILQAGLRPGRASTHETEPRLGRLLREGLAAGKEPGLSLSYASAFVARADLALVGAFLILWAQQYGQNTLGLTSGEATARAGLLLATANGTALLAAPLIGVIADRMGRTDAVLDALAVTAVGYSATLLVSNPFSATGYAVAVLIGVGQVSAVIASQVLVAEQAPPRIRGSVVGMFSLFGGIGIMIALGVGGVLFDAWRPAGPFLLFGVTAALVLGYGLVVRHRITPDPYSELDDDTAHSAR